MTLSLIELIHLLEERLGRPIRYEEAAWRPSDQKVYISRIDKAKSELGWMPRVTPAEGVAKLLAWAQENQHLFAHLRP